MMGIKNSGGGALIKRPACDTMMLLRMNRLPETVPLTADEEKRAKWREYARKARAKKLAAKMQEQNISA